MILKPSVVPLEKRYDLPRPSCCSDIYTIGPEKVTLLFLLILLYPISVQTNSLVNIFGL